MFLRLGIAALVVSAAAAQTTNVLLITEAASQGR